MRVLYEAAATPALQWPQARQQGGVHAAHPARFRNSFEPREQGSCSDDDTTAVDAYQLVGSVGDMC